MPGPLLWQRVSGIMRDLQYFDHNTGCFRSMTITKRIAQELGVNTRQVEAAVKLLDEGAFEMDPQKRKDIYAQVQKRALELCPLIFLAWREQAEGAQAYVKGYTHIPGIYDSSRTLEVTWLDK